MARPKTPPTEHLLFDYWQASKPEADEHILAFTINFSHEESNRLKQLGQGYTAAAFDTVKRILNRSGKSFAIDMVLVVERHKKLSKPHKSSQPDLHVHGWMRTKKNFTVAMLEAELKAYSGRKIKTPDGICVTDRNHITGKPVDSGWVAYLAKDFNRTPTGCASPLNRISATGHTKSSATRTRIKRNKDMDKLMRIYRDKFFSDFKDASIRRNTGFREEFFGI